jgi:ankyrin repeat protein
MNPSAVKSIRDAIPVMIASLTENNLFVVNALLDKFPRLIEMRDTSGRNLLMLACYLSDPSIVNYFLSFYVIANQRLDPNAVDDDGLNAHDWAVLGGNEFARSLMAKVMDRGDYQ